MNYLEQIRRNATDAVTSEKKVSDRYNEFREVLNAVATVLSQGNVDAKIRQSADGKLLNLVFSPRHQPGFATIILSAILEGGTIKILDKTIRTPQSLQKELAIFSAKPELRDSLQEIHQLALRPVEANLREAISLSQTNNVLVEVSPDDQRRFDEAKPNTSLSFTISRFDFPGNPEIPLPNERYQFLSSAGLYLKVAEIKQEHGNSYVITGTKFNRA